MGAFRMEYTGPESFGSTFRYSHMFSIKTISRAGMEKVRPKSRQVQSLRHILRPGVGNRQIARQVSETPVLSVAREWLGDDVRKSRMQAASAVAVGRGKMRVRDAVATYRERLDANTHLKAAHARVLARGTCRLAEVLAGIDRNRDVFPAVQRQPRKQHADGFAERARSCR